MPSHINAEAGQPAQRMTILLSFCYTLSNQTRTLIIIIIIIYPGNSGHAFTHTHTPGHIYPGKTRTRFCYPCPGAPACDHGAGCITPLGKSGCSSYCTKFLVNPPRQAYQNRGGCQRCRACRFCWPGLPAEKLDQYFFGLVYRPGSRSAFPPG